MTFAGHGYYTIQQEENFFIISYNGSWNVESAEAVFEDFKKMLASSGYAKFGIISDLRKWEGSTSEALAVAKKGLDYLYAHGQVFSVQVCDSFLTQKLAEPIHSMQKQRMPCAQFDTMQAAVEWMKNQVEDLNL